jgi:hypothetical protein
MVPRRGLILRMIASIKKVVEYVFLPPGEKLETGRDRIHVISVRDWWGVGSVKRRLRSGRRGVGA